MDGGRRGRGERLPYHVVYSELGRKAGGNLSYTLRAEAGKLSSR